MNTLIDLWQYRSGSILGYGHLEKRINNQDSFFLDGWRSDSGKSYVYGVVFDGCTNLDPKKQKTKRTRNEVGAVLLSDYFSSEIPIILAAGNLVQDVPQILYHRCIGHLGSLARMSTAGSPQKMWKFIEDRLMTTVMGFIMDIEKVVIFYAGDGMYVVNDKIYAKRHKAPHYLAYHLFDRNMLPADYELPQNFNVESYATNDIGYLLIATDGLVQESDEKNHETIQQIRCYESEASAGIQWWLNINSSEGLFKDDTTIIELRRKEQDVITK